jgi:hypothetical protein
MEELGKSSRLGQDRELDSVELRGLEAAGFDVRE